jgi:hypothetical protein
MWIEDPVEACAIRLDRMPVLDRHEYFVDVDPPSIIPSTQQLLRSGDSPTSTSYATSLSDYPFPTSPTPGEENNIHGEIEKEYQNRRCITTLRTLCKDKFPSGEVTFVQQSPPLNMKMFPQEIRTLAMQMLLLLTRSPTKNGGSSSLGRASGAPIHPGLRPRGTTANSVAKVTTFRVHDHLEHQPMLSISILLVAQVLAGKRGFSRTPVEQLLLNSCAKSNLAR